MLVIGNIPHVMEGSRVLSSYIISMAVLNAFFLVLMSSPLIYLWVIKPFVEAKNEALAQVTQLAHYDALTGLANRRLIYQHLEKLLARSLRHQSYGALLMLDLNKFKAINDHYGHDAGDAILIAVAKQLVLALRQEDVVGRLGGDEFVVLLSQLEGGKNEIKERLAKVCETLQSAINIPLSYNNVTLQVGASIGICLFSREKITRDEVVKRADIAMYQAKVQGQAYRLYAK